MQIGNGPQPGVQFDKLIVVELLPVCSPDYLRRLPVAAIEDLFGHVLLCSVQPPNDWLPWFRAAEDPEDRLRQVVRS